MQGRVEVGQAVNLRIVLSFWRQNHGNLAHNDWKIPDVRYKGNVTLKLSPSSSGVAELGLDEQGVVGGPDNEVRDVVRAISSLESRIMLKAETGA